jgi:hypothetical protein
MKTRRSRMRVLGSSKATNVACLAVFDPDTNHALCRQLEINIFVYNWGPGDFFFC